MKYDINFIKEDLEAPNTLALEFQRLTKETVSYIACVGAYVIGLISYGSITIECKCASNVASSTGECCLYGQKH